MHALLFGTLEYMQIIVSPLFIAFFNFGRKNTENLRLINGHFLTTLGHFFANYSSVPNSSACTFINFEKKIHPARSYLGLHVYWFWQNFPPCTFITPCTFIGLYYKFFTVVTFLQAKQSKQSYNGYLLTFILQSLKYFSCQIIFHYIFVICTQNYAPLLIFWK